MFVSSVVANKLIKKKKVKNEKMLAKIKSIIYMKVDYISSQKLSQNNFKKACTGL